MGNSYSPDSLQTLIQNQILKHKRNQNRSYLNIREMFSFEVPEKLPISTHTISILYTIDSDKNGKFTFEKIWCFLQFCQSLIENRKCSEIDFEIKAMCTQILVSDLLNEQSKKCVIEWYFQEGDHLFA